MPYKTWSALVRSWKAGRTAERRGAAEAERRREVERSDPDFSISGKDARSLDHDKHRGHNKVWINEQSISPRRWSPKVSSRDREFSLFIHQYELSNIGSTNKRIVETWTIEGTTKFKFLKIILNESSHLGRIWDVQLNLKIWIDKRYYNTILPGIIDNVMLLNFSAHISRKIRNGKGKIKERSNRFIGRPLKNHFVYVPCRPFRGIFAASLVPFDERIPGWMSAENIRGGKIIKIAVSDFFDMNSFGILLELSDILYRRSKPETTNERVCAVTVIVRLSLRDVMRYAENIHGHTQDLEIRDKKNHQ